MLGVLLAGIWLSQDFNPLYHSLTIVLLPLSGSWLAGEFSPEALPGRNDRLFVLIKYFLVSFGGVWSACSSFGLVGPLPLHDNAEKWFGRGDAPLAMMWLLVILAIFWILFVLRRAVLGLVGWLMAGK